jgi:hypothetical protein
MNHHRACIVFMESGSYVPSHPRGLTVLGGLGEVLWETVQAVVKTRRQPFLGVYVTGVGRALLVGTCTSINRSINRSINQIEKHVSNDHTVLPLYLHIQYKYNKIQACINSTPKVIQAYVIHQVLATCFEHVQ